MKHPLRDDDARYGYWQVETSGSCTARIEVQNPPVYQMCRSVAMPADDRMYSSSERVKIDAGEVMEDMEHDASYYHGFRDRKALYP